MGLARAGAALKSDGPTMQRRCICNTKTDMQHQNRLRDAGFGLQVRMVASSRVSYAKNVSAQPGLAASSMPRSEGGCRPTWCLRGCQRDRFDRQVVPPPLSGVLFATPGPAREYGAAGGLAGSHHAARRCALKHPGFDAHLIRVTSVLPDLVVSVVRNGNALIQFI